MKRPSKAVAERRAEQIKDLQAEIINDWNESRIGSITTVLVEGVESVDFRPTDMPAYALARSYAESPGIDGYIRIKTENIEANTFIDIIITGIEDGELVGDPT